MKDAQRHGVEVRPIDVARSDWECTLEKDGPRRAAAQRAALGLRYVRGLSAEAGERGSTQGARARPSRSLADFAARVAPKRHELDALAEAGALAGIDPAAGERRSALWQVGALERDPRSLFAGVAPPGAGAPSPLDGAGRRSRPRSPTTAARGLTTGPHVMAHLRPALAARGVLSARELRDASRTAASCAWPAT